MKVLRSSLFRAVSAIVIGALLIEYREQTVEWLTIVIGVLFFLSGVISLASYYTARKTAGEPEIYDSNGQLISGGQRPALPIVGLGSLILGTHAGHLYHRSYLHHCRIAHHRSHRTVHQSGRNQQTGRCWFLLLGDAFCNLAHGTCGRHLPEIDRFGTAVRHRLVHVALWSRGVYQRIEDI